MLKMSKWLMRSHFRHLHFNIFPMTWRTPQGKVFNPCNQTLKFQESQRTPKSPFRECDSHPHTLPKVGLRHFTATFFCNKYYKSKLCSFATCFFITKCHVQGYKSFSRFGWTLRTCKNFKRMTHHTPHELHPLMLTFVVFSFNTKKLHNFVMWWEGTQKLALVMSYIDHCLQIISFLVCCFWSTIAWTSCSTSFDKIKLSSSSITKWSDLVVWNSSP